MIRKHIDIKDNFRRRMNIFKIKVLVSFMLIAITGISVSFAVDYIAYVQGYDEVVIFNEERHMPTKSKFLENREIGAINIDNVFDTMYDTVDMGTISIDENLVNSEDALRLNEEILELVKASVEFERYKEVVPDAKGSLLRSTYEHIDHLMLVSKSMVEWEGNIDGDYAISPLVPGNKLKSAGIPPSNVKAIDIGKDYTSNMTSGDGKYLGPYQIENTYFTNSANETRVPYDYLPLTDEYEIEDASRFITGRLLHSTNVVHSSMKDYPIQSPYELVALWGISHNTGPAVFTEEDSFYVPSRPSSFPWINVGAMRQYISDLCRSENLVVILDRAEEDFLKFKDNPETYSYELPRLDRQEAAMLVLDTKLDYKDYIHSKFHKYIGTPAAGSTFGPEEKLGFPAEQIYNYHMAKLFYTSGGA